MDTTRLWRRTAPAREGQAGWMARAGVARGVRRRSAAEHGPSGSSFVRSARSSTAPNNNSRRQSMDNWTVEMVEERLVEAAAVMRRLPPVRVPGYFSTWPRDARGVRRSRWPATRADAAATAIAGRDQPDGGDAGMAALARSRGRKARLGCEPDRERWKAICWQFGIARATAHRRWQYGLSVIALAAQWPKGSNQTIT